MLCALLFIYLFFVSAVSTQLPFTGDVNGLAFLNQSPGDSEETCGIIDIKHKIVEVTIENNDTDNSVEQAKGVCLQDHILALDQENLQDDGSEEHGNLSCVGNSVSSCVSEGAKKGTGRKTVDDEPVRQHSQVTLSLHFMPAMIKLLA